LLPLIYLYILYSLYCFIIINLWEITPTNNIFRYMYIHTMESVKVFLTTAQKNEMQGGKPFQLSATQLQAGSGKHPVEIQMTAKNHKALLKNVSKGKGYRFSADKIEGAGFFGDLAKKAGKKVAKAVAEKALDKIGEKTGQSGITNALKGSVDGLVDVGADKISKKVSGGKLTKGSPEMKARMAKLRGMRKGKGMDMNMEMIEGEGVFEDLGRKIKRSFTKTFNPALGRKIKDAFTSKPAREIYKGLSRGALALGSSFSGLPLGLAQGEIDRQIDGASIKGKRFAKKNLMVEGGTLVAGVPHVMRMGNNPQIRHGGVMTKVGKGFTSSKGTHYGGSFMSPTSGGSFTSP
jgi:hypothetical protein